MRRSDFKFGEIDVYYDDDQALGYSVQTSECLKHFKHLKFNNFGIQVHARIRVVEGTVRCMLEYCNAESGDTCRQQLTASFFKGSAEPKRRAEVVAMSAIQHLAKLAIVPEAG